MAKKTHVKVRLVPESKPDSPFFYYVKKWEYRGEAPIYIIRGEAPNKEIGRGPEGPDGEFPCEGRSPDAYSCTTH